MDGKCALYRCDTLYTEEPGASLSQQNGYPGSDGLFQFIPEKCGLVPMRLNESEV